MSETFRNAVGRRVVSRVSAEELGEVRRLVVSADARRIEGIVVGRGRKSQVVDWAGISGFGPDAVMVAAEPVPGSVSSQELIGMRLLSELGNELGSVEDVAFDASTGTVEALLAGGAAHPVSSMLGRGSYAIVVAGSAEKG